MKKRQNRAQMGRKSAENKSRVAVTSGDTAPPAASPELVAVIKSGFAELGGKIGNMDSRISELEKTAGAARLPTEVPKAPAATEEFVSLQVKAQADRIQSDFQMRLDGMESRLSETPATPEQKKTFAEMIHASEAYKKSLARTGDMDRTKRNFGVRGSEFSLIAPAEGKAEITLGSAELSPLLVPFHRGPVVEPKTERSDFLRLIPRVPIGGKETYDFRRETEASRLGYVSTTIVGAVAAIDTTITVADANGIVTDTYVRFHVAAGIQRFPVSRAGNVLTLLDAPGGSPTAFGTTAVGGERATSENYGATAESAEKPFGILEYETVILTLKTFATVLGLTQQRMDSLPQFQGFVERKLRASALRNLSWQLLYGDDASALEIPGLASETGVQTYAWSSGVAGDTMADAVARAAALIPGNGMLTLTINKADWNSIKLVKAAADGHYMHTNLGPVVLVDTPTQKFLGPYMVNFDDAVVPGDFFLVDHAETSEWPHKDLASAFSAGWINDDFILNQLKVRYEDTLSHAILTTSGYVYGTFDAAP